MPQGCDLCASKQSHSLGCSPWRPPSGSGEYSHGTCKTLPEGIPQTMTLLLEGVLCLPLTDQLPGDSDQGQLCPHRDTAGKSSRPQAPALTFPQHCRGRDAQATLCPLPSDLCPLPSALTLSLLDLSPRGGAGAPVGDLWHL